MPYGAAIYNSSGELVLSQSTRLCNIVIRGNVVLQASTTSPYTVTSSPIAFPGLTTGNTGEFSFWSPSVSHNSAGTATETIVFNRGNGSFTITYNAVAASRTIDIYYYGIRY
jgi:hypothetical protein